ncbi:hypothetical protein BDV38DRAFT_239352 [Aspergillus pseudotamarii]|uniref:Uncharacterized protein n=1 Tax=Aspergillus pseudotamarii TaxID=132259 RepID=A0A5N6T3C2_ASPPS|nr:uncharacterized protein BDV38DRAFT_239352 [Aspergillus pseudotamarii]KAE8140769.1 hypothetical protein BDV38DRAFT_239352 [Aspergillus pseudotamarii]
MHYATRSNCQKSVNRSLGVQNKRIQASCRSRMEGLPWTAERGGRTADGELQSPLPSVCAALPVVVPVTRLVGKLFLGHRFGACQGRRICLALRMLLSPPQVKEKNRPSSSHGREREKKGMKHKIKREREREWVRQYLMRQVYLPLSFPTESENGSRSDQACLALTQTGGLHGYSEDHLYDSRKNKLDAEYGSTDWSGQLFWPPLD